VGINHETVQWMDRETDGMWTFMSGREDQAFLDDPANSAIYALEEIAEIDPSIVPYLSMPPGSSLTRTAAGFTVDT